MIFRFSIALFILVPWTFPATAQLNTSEYLSHKAKSDHIFIQTNNGFVAVQFWAAGVFRIVYSSDSILNSPSDAVTVDPLKGPPFEAVSDHTHYKLAGTSVIISQNPFAITFSDNCLTRTITLTTATGFKDGVSAGFVVNLTQGERITGGGARALPMNRRGYALRLNNEPHWGYGFGEENLNYSLPVFISSDHYMLFYDAPQRAFADIAKTTPDKLTLYSSEEEQSCFLIFGTDFREILKKYCYLTGTQPLPPRWAFGNLQSRFGYKSQQETLEKADSMIQDGFPLDAMIIDLYWFGKGLGDFRMGNLDWESDQWPAPQSMVDTLLSKGVKTILITEPFIMKTSSNWEMTDSLKLLGKKADHQSFVIEDFWFGPAGLIDVFDAKATDWFWGQYKRLKKTGIAGWWGDLGEPEKHPSGILYKSGTSDQLHNIYGHYWSKLLAEGYYKDFPRERLFFLNRAGFAGSQRYSVFPWSGDVSRSWSGFEAQLPIMLAMSLTGIPYMHSDLGGFAGGVKDDELYRRWLQFGVFNPVFRPHGETIPSEPIYFNDTTRTIVREAIRLRYRLIPYNYTLAWEQTTEGTPLARPLIWYHPANPDYFDVYDTYYWGKNILVSPVLKPGQKGKDVPLPPGYWYDFYTNQPIEGGRYVQAAIDQETIPVFVKAGSIIPTVPLFQSTDYYRTDTLLIHYYAHSSTERSGFTMYDDDGKNAMSLQTKQFQLIHFLGINTNKFTFLKISPIGKYPGVPLKRHYIVSVNINERPRRIKAGKKTINPSQINYDPQLKVVRFETDGEHRSLEITIVK